MSLDERLEVTAAAALDRLREGNSRFVAGLRSLESLSSQTHRTNLTEGQTPFAVIVGCSDSRVPVEIVFDQGLGDLFVIRVAGNIVAPSQIGSVEFAAMQFGTRLVVVLGHTGCGAIEATLEQLRASSGNRSPHLEAIVSRIRPAVEPLLAGGAARDPSLLHRQAVRANVLAAADTLRHGSPILERLGRDEGLLVVGAEYSLETGFVDFFDAGGISSSVAASGPATGA